MYILNSISYCLLLSMKGWICYLWSSMKVGAIILYRSRAWWMIEFGIYLRLLHGLIIIITQIIRLVCNKIGFFQASLSPSCLWGEGHEAIQPGGQCLCWHKLMRFGAWRIWKSVVMEGNTECWWSGKQRMELPFTREREREWNLHWVPGVPFKLFCGHLFGLVIE